MIKKSAVLQLVCVVTIVNGLWLSLMKWDIATIGMFGAQMILGVSFFLWLTGVREKYVKKGK